MKATNYQEYLQAKKDGVSFNRFDNTFCDLEGADLRGAYLRGAELTGAYLTGAEGIIKASGLGSELREAFAYTPKNSPIMFQAGCFNGTAEELLAASEKKHGKESKEYRGYAAFVALAQVLLEPCIEIENAE